MIGKIALVLVTVILPRMKLP